MVFLDYSPRHSYHEHSFAFIQLTFRKRIQFQLNAPLDFTQLCEDFFHLFVLVASQNIIQRRLKRVDAGDRWNASFFKNIEIHLEVLQRMNSIPVSWIMNLFLQHDERRIRQAERRLTRFVSSSRIDEHFVNCCSVSVVEQKLVEIFLQDF